MTEEKSALAGRRVDTCSRCGASFSCGVDEAGGPCWCAALPSLPAIPDPGKGCLCPDCLRAALREMEIHKKHKHV